MTPRLNLIVVRATDLVRTRNFYAQLGLQFTEERHGTGPLHYACSMDALVLEIYPASAARPADPSTRPGFAVADVAGAVESLVAAGATIVSGPAPSAWGIRAVVSDPDQRQVELLEAGD